MRKSSRMKPCTTLTRRKNYCRLASTKLSPAALGSPNCAQGFEKRSGVERRFASQNLPMRVIIHYRTTRQVIDMADSQSLVTMKGIAKSFPGVVALEDVDFSLRKGEIHALMGENGAGKSTLVKILTGVEHPDKGSIELEGKPVQVRSPQHSQQLGISTVYQEINL